MYGKEFVNFVVLCEYVFKFWYVFNIILIWEWKVNKIWINVILNWDYDWFNMFFWFLMDEVLWEYILFLGERVENGLLWSIVFIYWYWDGIFVLFGMNV